MTNPGKAESFSTLIMGTQPVLVDFYAEWCGPCKVMKPVLEELSLQMKGKIRIIKVDVDKSPSASSTYGVQAVPTLVLFQSGRILWRHSGVMQAAELKKIIETQISG